ncbi:MAG: aminotransferase class V-fold PLP-dependent enzyme [Lachnospiraceae bacterium]|nr:aminotransferase class V-fold PLP-dependent enzyme [Lachnospiraceae bacterium]
MMKKIPLATPTMHTEEQKYVQKAFETNWISPLGPNVDEFEDTVAAYVGASSCAALSSGTAALHLSVILAGVKENDIVFVPSLTFAASVNPIRYEYATPVFIDSERDTWNMDTAALRKAFEKYPHPKAVMAVHLYGTSANLDEICALCKEHDVPLIEDAAESLGTTYKGKMTGTFGEYGIYSFNGNKIITTSGGGILVAKQEKNVDKARFLSRQARDPARHYQHSTIGYNYRMSNVDAGIGCGQMQHIEEHIQKKQEMYQAYKEAFSDIEEIEMNPLNREAVDNNWLSCMTISPDSSVTPTQIMNALEAEGIETRPIWKPMHLQPIFAAYDFIQIEDGVSVSEDIFRRGLCLPSDIKNTKEDMERIIKIVRRQFRQQ